MTNDCKSPIMTGRGDTEDPEVSRRNFFQHTVRGAVVLGAGAVSAMTMSGAAQAQYGGGPYVWKSIASYRDAPNGPQFCARARRVKSQRRYSSPNGKFLWNGASSAAVESSHQKGGSPMMKTAFIAAAAVLTTAPVITPQSPGSRRAVRP
jgi:hypothetical protein